MNKDQNLLLKMDLKMKLKTLSLSCIFIVVDTGSEFRQYCYDSTRLGCEEHILDCGEGQVITTDIPNFQVSYYKNKNYPECQTEKDGCKNKTTCCRYINSSVTIRATRLTANDRTKLINFIKTECSFKSSCKISFYYIGSSNLFDFTTYYYGCVSQATKAVDFLVNGSTEFTGNRFPTLYYLDYTANGLKGDNEMKLNRECSVTTTENDISLTIKKLNLQAGDCCRFHISGYNVSEYCSQNGSFIPPKAKYISRNTAAIKLENVANKDGDNFSILIRGAGNVTIDCRTIEHLNKQEPTTCQYPTPQSNSISKSSTSATICKESIRASSMEKRETKYSDRDLASIIGGTVGVLVFLNIIFIIIVVVIVRRKLRTKQTTNEIQHYSSLDGLRNSQENNYAGIETASPTRP